MEKRRKKKKSYRCEFMLNDDDYQKLLLVTGEYDSFTEIWEKALRGYYYSIFKTNDLPNKPKEKVKTEEKEEKNNWYDEKQSEKEAIELEKLKAARRLRKEGASND